MSISTIVVGALVSALAFAAGWLSSAPAVRRLRQETSRQRLQLQEANRCLTHDALTGLLNRVGVIAAYHEEVARGDRPTLVVFDLDRFKTVNDTLGHAAGDQLLVAVADRLATVAKDYGGVAGRLSGDEFLLVLPAAAAYRDAVNACRWDLQVSVTLAVDGEVVGVEPRASAGVALHADDNDSFGDQMRKADAALYHAKRDGHGGFRAYVNGMTMPARNPHHRRAARDAAPVERTVRTDG